MYRAFIGCFLIIITLLAALSSSFSRNFFSINWTSYYKEKLFEDPRPLLVKAAKLIQVHKDKCKRAFDLGAGNGNETAYLLKNGWHVWSNDIESESIRLQSSREDIDPFRQKLTLLNIDFTEIPWNDLPQFDLIYAGYSLPFAHPSDFMCFWKCIVQAIEKNGLFAGHFFGLDHASGFNWWMRRNMTFLSKDQLLTLFEDFTIEVFEELHEKDAHGEWDHCYYIIARKL